MSRDTILKDEEGNCYSFDSLSTQRWLEGQEAGAQAAAAYLRDLAVEAFRDRKDKEAVIFRELADEILAKVCPKLKAKAKEHAEKYPYEGPF